MFAEYLPVTTVLDCYFATSFGIISYAFYQKEVFSFLRFSNGRLGIMRQLLIKNDKMKAGGKDEDN
jgi:hypothetical protein